ncbi:ATPase [Rhodococcus sp. ABRD24]|nr:ATPase [Rhodococcus sp. ABRD24]
MQRIAIVAPSATLREVLVRVAAAGTVEIDRADASDGTAATGGGEAGRRLQRLGVEGVEVSPSLSPDRPDLDVLERQGRADLLAGEEQLEACAAAAVVRGEAAALAGWISAADVPDLSARLLDTGGAVVPSRPSRGLDPPTVLRSGSAVRQSFSPLVNTYGTVPYADVDPTVLAGVAYMFMFGMMFGDVGHGALLVLLGLILRTGRPVWVARYRKVWPFVVGSGLAAIGFGLLYGEFFGPTGVVPVLWLSPLDQPVTLLGSAIGVGAVLLACAYVVGTVNRWREGGWATALSAPSGIAGAALFAGLGLAVLGAVAGRGWLIAGTLVAAAGLVLAAVGFLAGAGGGLAGAAQAVVELFDAVIRLGANLVSFARLAAFGLTHAALGQVVWDGTTGLWGVGGWGVAAALLVFVLGNVLAFALEALVAGVQALRLEYYELFSRVFVAEGRPFRPWHVPLDTSRRTP